MKISGSYILVGVIIMCLNSKSNDLRRSEKKEDNKKECRGREQTGTEEEPEEKMTRKRRETKKKQKRRRKKKKKLCSTSPPRGHQVDGLPPACTFKPDWASKDQHFLHIVSYFCL